MSETRRMTGKLIDMAEQGDLSWESVALSCLYYMSESDVADMAWHEYHLKDVNDDEQDETGD